MIRATPLAASGEAIPVGAGGARAIPPRRTTSRGRAEARDWPLDRTHRVHSCIGDAFVAGFRYMNRCGDQREDSRATVAHGRCCEKSRRRSMGMRVWPELLHLWEEQLALALRWSYVRGHHFMWRFVHARVFAGGMGEREGKGIRAMCRVAYNVRVDAPARTTALTCVSQSRMADAHQELSVSHMGTRGGVRSAGR
eukprot:1587713-Pyramimonas_sp.AAC.1